MNSNSCRQCLSLASSPARLATPEVADLGVTSSLCQDLLPGRCSLAKQIKPRAHILVQVTIHRGILIGQNSSLRCIVTCTRIWAQTLMSALTRFDRLLSWLYGGILPLDYNKADGRINKPAPHPPTLVSCWTSLADCGPTLNQHRVNISCLG